MSKKAKTVDRLTVEVRYQGSSKSKTLKLTAEQVATLGAAGYQALAADAVKALVAEVTGGAAAATAAAPAAADPSNPTISI